MLVLVVVWGRQPWVKMRRAPSDLTIRVTLAIRLSNTEFLDDMLLQVSDPDSKIYGMYLVKDEVNEFIRPSLSTVFAVEKWLESQHVPKKAITRTSNSDFISVFVPISLAEKMFNASMYEFVNLDKNMNVIRSEKLIQVPEELEPFVDFVSPNHNFPNLDFFAMNQDLSGVPFTEDDFGVSPASLRKLYEIPDKYRYSKSPDNRQAVAQFLNQFYSPEDLKFFLQRFNNDTSDVDPVILRGPNNSSDVGVEANLDIQYMISIGGNVSTQFWSTLGSQPGSDCPDNEPFLSWLIDLAHTEDDFLPWVISVSYGDDEDSVDIRYAARINIEFQKAGLRGVSILFASGDGGIAGSRTRDSCAKFVPTFPAASPWVTAVGGACGNENQNPEVGAELSGGGFSNYWSRPEYQKQAVQHYFETAKKIPPKYLFNVSGAAFPDVSAQSMFYWLTFENLTIPGASGTSASTPVVAGIVSLLNDIRLLEGKSTLGFLNPLFYKNPHIFNDIVNGSNPSCQFDGFEASKGWDPGKHPFLKLTHLFKVTGLGTPNFPRMLELISKLPSGRRTPGTSMLELFGDLFSKPQAALL